MATLTLNPYKVKFVFLKPLFSANIQLEHAMHWVALLTELVTGGPDNTMLPSVGTVCPCVSRSRCELARCTVYRCTVYSVLYSVRGLSKHRQPAGSSLCWAGQQPSVGLLSVLCLTVSQMSGLLP